MKEEKGDIETELIAAREEFIDRIRARYKEKEPVIRKRLKIEGVLAERIIGTRWDYRDFLAQREQDRRMAIKCISEILDNRLFAKEFGIIPKWRK